MKYFYTASYFAPNTHHGIVLSISVTNPKGFEMIDKFPELTPTPDILAYWKKTVKEYTAKQINKDELDARWEKYSDSYLRSLDRRSGAIRLRMVNLLNQQKNTFTLLCWEKPNSLVPNCHRDLAGKWLADRYNLDWYQDLAVDMGKKKEPLLVETGTTIPVMEYLDRLKADFAKKGLIVEFVPVSQDDFDSVTDKPELLYPEEPSFFVVYANGVPLGMWGQSAFPALVKDIKSQHSIVFD